MSHLILVVEDERDLLTTMEFNLQQAGYQTRGATTGADALRLAAQLPQPDLVLLDLMLPDIAGTEVCRRLRATEGGRRIPVIFVTAKGEEIDRVVGFELGADDYVVKPFSVRELMLRVRAVLRRAGNQEQAMAETEAEADDAEVFIDFGVLRIDQPGHRCWVDGEEVHLTALEFRLLTTFYERRGRVQSRERLLTDVWGYSADVTTRTVDTHIKRLREKLGDAAVYVETVRGVGYRFRERPDGAR
ncbi:MAG: two-component system phosphate regulon response regulator PhoB [Bradymonadia bacterium]|jgi:two-component system phosphate regulon response regulator PhoB